jgi:hypothetical protein
MSQNSANLNSEAPSVFPISYKIFGNGYLHKGLLISVKERACFLDLDLTSKSWHES